MGLEEYRKKRDFSKTPEPSGRQGRRRQKNLSFCVQLHLATHRHYDFRLEFGGRLRSWAVPKGPDLDPREKRLAVRVEDHPIAYGSFEGVIPKGQYGAGTVLLWDRGEWIPKGDPEAQYEEGALKFELRGEKLMGLWTLVRIKNRDGGDPDKHWLLIKERDDEARSGAAARVIDLRPESVLTGKLVEEIAARPERQWPPPEVEVLAPDPERISGAQKATFPKKIAPSLPTRVPAPPAGDDWWHEIKLDGYRGLISVQDGRAQFWTRNGHDWSERLPSLCRAAKRLPVRSAWLDGELVALDERGISSFSALQNSLSGGRDALLVFYAFDLLYLDGWDLRRAPLEARKAALARLLTGQPDEGPLLYCDHHEGQGEAFFEQVKRFGLEGIVSKKKSARYVSGRSDLWLKVKLTEREELLVIGFTRPKGSSVGLGALALALPDESQRLRYAGKVGTGFSEASAVEILARLAPLVQDHSPLAPEDVPKELKQVTWVRPEVVAEVEFTSRTENGQLRHPSFQGLRDDVDPGDLLAKVNAPIASTEVTPAPKNGSDEALRMLDAIAGMDLTNPGKVLYPECGVNKMDLAVYYASIAEWILPHLEGRPLSLLRCPDGHTRECFFQKHASLGMPDGIQVLHNEREGKEQEILTLRDLRGLLGLVQLGVLEIHPWGCRTDRIDRPDRLVFDLDPGPGVSWQNLVAGTLTVHQLLEELGLESFVKTTGGKGYHVVVPIERRLPWDRAKQFTLGIARLLAKRHPTLFVATSNKDARTCRIYLDTLRNAQGATAVAAFSTRARPGAPVSAPIAWPELEKGVRPDQFDVKNLPRRLGTLEHDPWADLDRVRQRVTQSMERAMGGRK
ncbi:MAG: DNA ligase D [Planctomycetota bacterium]